MSTSAPAPSKKVACTYTAVLSSRATRYYAIAPTKPYQSTLATQLTNDVSALVSAHTDGATCCGILKDSTTADDLSAVASPCVCLSDVTLSRVNQRFDDQVNLLGLTFVVKYDVYVIKGGAVVAADTTDTTTSSEPSLPFSWSLVKSTAFPFIVKNLFHALTRKDYLSALTTTPNVFAHVTIDEVDAMLHLDFEKANVTYYYNYGNTDDDDDDDDGKVGHVVADARQPTQPSLPTRATQGRSRVGLTIPSSFNAVPNRAAAPHASSTTTLDYCTVLRGPLSASYVYVTPLVTYNASAQEDGGATAKDGPNAAGTTTYTYPLPVVYAAQDYLYFESSQCSGSMCSLGILCGVIMILLMVAAGVAFVVQYCRRNQNEREDERKLLQRQLH